MHAHNHTHKHTRTHAHLASKKSSSETTSSAGWAGSARGAEGSAAVNFIGLREQLLVLPLCVLLTSWSSSAASGMGLLINPEDMHCASACMHVTHLLSGWSFLHVACVHGQDETLDRKDLVASSIVVVAFLNSAACLWASHICLPALCWC